MRFLLALGLSGALGAQPPANACGPQVWDAGSMVVLTADEGTPRFGLDRRSLLELDLRGSSRTLRAPGILRWPRLSHWKGRSFAYGFPDHPAWRFPDLGKQAWRFPHESLEEAYRNSDQHLYQSSDFQTWRFLARYGAGGDGHGRIQSLVPLEDGAFLALGFGAFWEWNRVSPAARYRVDGGRLVFERLVELGPGGVYDVIPISSGPGQARLQARSGYEGIQRGRWLVARAPEGLVLFHASGWYFVLDNRDGRYLRQGRLLAPEGQVIEVLDANPGSDGRILVVSASVGMRRGTEIPAFPQQGDNAPTRLVRALVRIKGLGRVGALEGPARLVWHRLEPASGRLRLEQPPKGVPTRLPGPEARWRFRFTLRFDGDLSVTPVESGGLGM